MINSWRLVRDIEFSLWRWKTYLLFQDILTFGPFEKYRRSSRRQETKRWRRRRASWQTQTTVDIPPSIAQTGCYKFARTNAAAPFQRFCRRYRYLREKLFTVGATANASANSEKCSIYCAAQSILRKTKVYKSLQWTASLQMNSMSQGLMHFLQRFSSIKLI